MQYLISGKSIFRTALIWILLLHYNSFCYSQTIRSATEQLAAEIAKENILTGDAVGISGDRPEQWNRFEGLRNFATADELIVLLDYPNGVVRAYAFHALALKKHKNIFPLLIEQLYDTAAIQTIFGCIGFTVLVSDYCLDVVTPELVDLDAYKLNTKERHIVDSILIFDKRIRSNSRNQVFRKLKPSNKHYNRIRDIVRFEGNNDAIVALSRYRKPQDKELIVARLLSPKTDVQFYGLLAVTNFPDSSFFPYLAKIHSVEIKKPTGFDYSMLRQLYQAIVQYKNQSSRLLIEKTFAEATENAKTYHSEAVWLAVKKYPNVTYNDLISKITLSAWQLRELTSQINNNY